MHDDEEIRRLFCEHVPEVASGVVEIKGIARDPGQRTIVAVHSPNRSVCADPVGSCVGLNSVRVKAIFKKLQGEKIDIVKWSDSIKTFIRNAVATARPERIVFDEAGHIATIHPSEDRTFILDQGTRLSLVSRLVGWGIRFMDAGDTPGQLQPTQGVVG